MNNEYSMNLTDEDWGGREVASRRAARFPNRGQRKECNRRSPPRRAFGFGRRRRLGITSDVLPPVKAHRADRNVCPTKGRAEPNLLPVTVTQGELSRDLARSPHPQKRRID